MNSFPSEPVLFHSFACAALTLAWFHNAASAQTPTGDKSVIEKTSGLVAVFNRALTDAEMKVLHEAAHLELVKP